MVREPPSDAEFRRRVRAGEITDSSIEIRRQIEEEGHVVDAPDLAAVAEEIADESGPSPSVDQLRENEAELEELPVKELRRRANAAGIKGRSGMNKGQLVDALSNAS